MTLYQDLSIPTKDAFPSRALSLTIINIQVFNHHFNTYLMCNNNNTLATTHTVSMRSMLQVQSNMGQTQPSKQKCWHFSCDIYWVLWPESAWYYFTLSLRFHFQKYVICHPKWWQVTFGYLKFIQCGCVHHSSKWWKKQQSIS